MSKEIVKLCEELKRELKAELREIKDTMERERKELRKDFRDVRSSMDFMNKSFEEMKEKLELVRAENVELKRENKQLESLCGQLSQRVDECEVRLMQSEQYSRNLNVELKGITVHRDEDLVRIVQEVGKTVGETIQEDDIEICHRVPVPNSEARNVVVQFVRRTKRNEFLEKARRKRFTCADIGFATGGPVFVNEHLCPPMKKLLGQAISKKKEKRWKFVWVRNGSIFARKAENTPVIKIASTADLGKLV